MREAPLEQVCGKQGERDGRSSLEGLPAVAGGVMGTTSSLPLISASSACPCLLPSSCAREVGTLVLGSFRLLHYSLQAKEENNFPGGRVRKISGKVPQLQVSSTRGPCYWPGCGGGRGTSVIGGCPQNRMGGAGGEAGPRNRVESRANKMALVDPSWAWGARECLMGEGRGLRSTQGQRAGTDTRDTALRSDRRLKATMLISLS